MHHRVTTVVLLALTVFVLSVSVPESLRDAYARGGIYLFSRAFFADIPARLAGPGSFRFFLQPVVAALVGLGSGVADARAGRPPYLMGLVFHRAHRRAIVRAGAEDIVNLLLIGVLLDSVFQWFILGVSHPFAALVLGPVLIVMPYAIARGLTNRVVRWTGRTASAGR